MSIADDLVSCEQSYEHVFDTVALPEDGLKAGGSLTGQQMRLGPLIAVGFAGALLGGCGSDDPPPKPQKPVNRTIASPVDTAIVQGGTTTVTRTVTPAGARVKVQGHVARVSGNDFTSRDKLAHGTNVIDVAATARGRATALTAFRITRVERVAVPDFTGLSVGDAEAEAKNSTSSSRASAAAASSTRSCRAGSASATRSRRPARGPPWRDGPRARRSPLLSRPYFGVTAISAMRGSPRSRTTPSTMRPSIGLPSPRSTR